MGEKPRFQKKNPYVDRRESKNREIRQALTHKSNLKRKYMKELERSGERLPELSERRDRPQRDASKPNFHDRQQLAKEHKKVLREAKEKEYQDRQELKVKKLAAREKKKEQLSQKTRTGQPKMGPRINSLLEKIEQQYGDKPNAKYT